MRVIVIEDDADAAAFVKRVLSEAGHAVDICGDGESGLNQARSGNYDALVVGPILPSGMQQYKPWELYIVFVSRQALC
jgi:two-component system OmpR family response regulator